jgi:glycosyltransferase involved in cell wall biosynthesis
VSVEASVVIPVHNGATTLPDCLRALTTQALDRARFEVIVVDDGSDDDSAAIAEKLGARVLRRPWAGQAAARNAGWAVARGPWVAFTDADCLPSRPWLARLLDAVDDESLGAAGSTVGYRPESPSARFADLIGSLDAARHLTHPRFPFPPSGNVLYRKDALAAVGGFDVRYRSYEACDLHTRLRERWAGPFNYEPRALVLHRHRETWPRYWAQQFSYGRGYGQFLWHRRQQQPWRVGDELHAWARVASAVGVALWPGGTSDERLVRRGVAVKQLAQRGGFTTTFWSLRERRRW